MEYVLETNHLTKKFGNKLALNDVNMHVERGEIYGFIGSNGAGKTTLMRLALGLALPSEGSINLFGMPATDASRARIGSLIETPSIYKSYSAYENLKLFSILYNFDERNIENVLKMVGLSDTGNKSAGAFSLGMKQRLGIAIALLGNPEFLILDEPVNGLDPAGIKDVRDLILSLNREYGITFLISSHLLDELSKMVTKYGIINNGYLLEEISAEDLSHRCTNKLFITTQNIDGAINVLTGAFNGIILNVDNGRIVLSNYVENAVDINRVLAENGILVSGLEVRAVGLEEYFVQRIGG